MKKVFRIEAVIDGYWHWFAGRVEDGSRLSGGTRWSKITEDAVTFPSRSEARREQRRLGGVTFVRE